MTCVITNTIIFFSLLSVKISMPKPDIDLLELTLEHKQWMSEKYLV